MIKKSKIVCHHCKKDAFLETWYIKKRLLIGAKMFFCNYKCFKKFSKEHRGKKHWNWRGGYKAFYEHKKELIKKRSLHRYYKHRKEILKQRKRYAIENKEKIKKYQKKYRPIANECRNLKYKTIPTYRIKRNTQNHNRRKLLITDGLFNINTIQEVYETNIKKYKTLTCEYCKKQIMFGQDTIDHKFPLSKGGGNEKENLCIACRSCNSSKHTKTDVEFMKIMEV